MRTNQAIIFLLLLLLVSIVLNIALALRVGYWKIYFEETAMRYHDLLMQREDEIRVLLMRLMTCRGTGN